MMISKSKKQKTSFTPLLMISLLAIFSFILKDYNLPIIAGYGMFLVIAFFFIGVYGGKLYFSKTQFAAIMLALIATVMVFLPYSRTAVNTVSVVMSLDIAMLYILICRPCEYDVERTLRMLVVAAVVMSTYAIAVSIYPNVYYGFVKHIIPLDTQSLIELGFRYHYGVSVGGESIVVDYYAFFGVVIALNTLLIKSRELKDRKKYIAIFVICVLAIIVQNRKAELFTTLIVIVFLFLSNVNVTSLKQKCKQILAFSLIAVIGITVFIILLRKGYLSRYDTFLTQLALRTSSVHSTVDISSGRTMLWGRALSLFKEHPVFGIGWGNFRNYLSDTFNVFNDGQLSNVHNNYLQILCETGIVGFIFFVFPLFYILYRTFKTIKYLRINMTNAYVARIAASTSLSFQLFYLGISFIDPVWYKMFTWPFYGISVILMIYAEKAVVY